MRNKARIATAAIALAASAATAAPALGASVTVTGDDGATQLPIANGSTTPLRNMKADVNVQPAAGERYRLAVTGPAGQAAASLDCYSIPTGDRLDYLGNGNYTGTLQVYTTSGCSGTPKSTITFTIAVNASVAINVPSGSKVLTREPGGTFKQYPIPVAQNPGALSTQIHYARNAVLGPDGGITGASERRYVDAATGVANFSFFDAGTYTLVAHAEAFTSGMFSPWSAPIVIRAYAPFEFSGGVSFPDSRGPVYKLRATLRDKGGKGKVKILMARGWKGGKFRSIGKAKIRGRVIKKTFTQHRTGKYRIRYIYKGSKLIAPGKITQKITIRRRFF
jgi:hypothetical protein